jgi:hypothetical protein
VLILPMLFGAFRPPKPDNRIWCDTHWVHLFMHCNHLPSPGLCKVFELEIDRANEVELLCAPLAFELCPSRSLPRHGINRELIAGQDREL